MKNPWIIIVASASMVIGVIALTIAAVCIIIKVMW